MSVDERFEETQLRQDSLLEVLRSQRCQLSRAERQIYDSTYNACIESGLQEEDAHLRAYQDLCNARTDFDGEAIWARAACVEEDMEASLHEATNPDVIYKALASLEAFVDSRVRPFVERLLRAAGLKDS